MKKKWLKPIINIVVIILIIYMYDYFKQIPHIEKIVLFFLLIHGVYTTIMLLKLKRKYSSKNYKRLKHENYNFYKVTNIFLGILFMLAGFFLYQSLESGLIGSINYSLLGLIILIQGIFSKHSIFLEKINDKEIIVENIDFKIEPEDKEMEFRRNQISLIKQDNEVLKLGDLELDFNEIREICNWISSSLNNSKLKYYKVTKNIRKEI